MLKPLIKVNNSLKSCCKIVATFGGVGLIPWAPGTFGSICAIPLFLLLPHTFIITIITIITLFIVGIITSHLYENYFHTHDPKEVVIDEVLGQYITLTGIQTFINYKNDFLNSSITIIVLSFILFRIFDILKPWPISIANDRLKGGIGIILDDVLAAFFAIITFVILSFIVLNALKYS
ncbi:MAG: phosphatidylglycerophosphatase A [Oligoflexia bacterium]|nr:phosphatidylglycerophosphatase A [Oligoflexia bacterium]